jgi:hypothetical protein
MLLKLLPALRLLPARAIRAIPVQIELAGEQSRYFDLLRWGLLKQVLNPELQAQYGAATFQDRNVLLPIPQQEKDTNPNVANDVANSRS